MKGGHVLRAGGRILRFALSLLLLSVAGIWTLAGAEVGQESRPGTYWWWMGSAVDSQNLRLNLRQLHEAGIGGVLVIPIYGVRGYESRFLEFLSPRWMKMFAYAETVAESLGMWLDMTTGTGWPFGGSHVTPEHAAKAVKIVRAIASPDRPLRLQLEPAKICAAVAFGECGRRLDISGSILSSGELAWRPDSGRWQVVILQQEGTRQQVKRAAPGNEGLVLDPFSPRAMHRYLVRFDSSFALSGAPWPRCQYHDSYEYYGANWTSDFLHEFEARRGYRLEDYLLAFAGQGSPDTVARVKADYRATLAELHLEYIRTWVNWAHSRGCLARNEAHGSPANLLDLYAAADIPETETFGSTPFPIPGLRRDPAEVRPEEPNPVILRFASSAAHVSGRNLVSSETCTWLREHFCTALSHIKPEIDNLFLAGINHIQYHGTAYSPADAPWPGWLFYASVHFQPTNPFWRDFPSLNRYVQRCQSVLQAGKPDNDVLLYWPIWDLWQDTTGYQQQLTVHNTSWVDGHAYGALAKELARSGYSFDFISDALLGGATVDSGQIAVGGVRYRAVVVPECRFLPLETWRKLEELARRGGSVAFHKRLPQDVPGLACLERRSAALQEAQRRLVFREEGGFRVARLGKGRFLLGEDIGRLLGELGVQRERLADFGVGVVRRALADGHFYFLANLGSEPLEGWVPLARPFRAAVLIDPLTGASGSAAVARDARGPLVYLQLQPGQSMILRTHRAVAPGEKPWRYWSVAAGGVELHGPWRVEFLEGGPELPPPFETDRLASWTVLGGPEAERFSGTAVYRATFRLPQAGADAWLLDLGDVRESARVRLNGREVGVAWAVPFHLVLTEPLRTGWNTLEVEVTNLAANRIRDMDRRGAAWKIFYDINFVSLQYRPFDASGWEVRESGLLGPVQLIPLRKFWPSLRR